MVKVIVGYRLKKGADIQALLLKLRSHAMQYPGFIGAETYIRNKERSIIMVVYTWQNAENWTAWENSTISQELIKEAEHLLEDKPRVAIYTIAPTVRWV